MAPKKKGGARGEPQPGTAKAAVQQRSSQQASQNNPEAQRKPSVKELIGGSSWTGKLPVNMLSEHCQKQKWEKPEYTMVGFLSHTFLKYTYATLLKAKTPDGFVSTVILQRVDPKTNIREIGRAHV